MPTIPLARRRPRPRAATAARAGLPRGLVVLGLAALAGCAGATEDDGAGVVIRGGDSGPYLGTNLDNPYEKPAAVFTDTTGNDFDFARDTTAPVTLVFFGYTNCPDVCFTELSDVALALRNVAPEVRDAAQVVFVTTDPPRDTPEVMTAYLDRFGFPSYVGLTAPIETITEVGYDLGIAVAEGKKLPSGGYEVAHGTQVIGFGPDGTAPVFWNDVPHEDMARDIATLAEAA
jgi:protein SCO1/2